jgi:hypothetical protein
VRDRRHDAGDLHGSYFSLDRPLNLSRHMKDLGNKNATPVLKTEYERPHEPK